MQGRLKEFFRYCRKAKWIDENPAEDLGTIKIKKNEQIRTDPFAPEEMQRIFLALERAFENERTRGRVRALILVQRHAGLSIEDGIILPRTGVEEKDNYRVITDRKKTGAHIDSVIPTWVAAPHGEWQALSRSRIGNRYSARSHVRTRFATLGSVLAGVMISRRTHPTGRP